MAACKVQQPLASLFRWVNRPSRKLKPVAFYIGSLADLLMLVRLSRWKQLPALPNSIQPVTVIRATRFKRRKRAIEAVGQRCGADTLPAISVFIGKSSETALSTLEIPATQLRGMFMCNLDPQVWGDRACDGLAQAGTICATVACQLAYDGSFSRKFSDRFGDLLLRQRP
jgi:hypothetical protein